MASPSRSSPERLECIEANIVRTYRHFIPDSDPDASEFMHLLFDAAPAAFLS